MKLNKTKVHFILRQYRKHASTKEISRDVKVSQRRVQQIIKQNKETGLEPILGEKVGRPFKPYDDQESEIVQEAHARYRFGARMLEVVIRKQYKIRISHNRIHMYLKHQGRAQDDEKKQKRRKWVRYERKHSLSAGHIDWHEWDGTSIKVCVILDDLEKEGKMEGRLMKGYEVGNSIHGDRIIAEARKISDPLVIVKSARHKAQRIVLTENALAEIDRKSRWCSQE